MRDTFFLKPSLSSRHCLAASTLAGDSSLGDDSMAMMEMTIDSTCVHKTWQESSPTTHASCAARRNSVRASATKKVFWQAAPVCLLFGPSTQYGQYACCLRWPRDAGSGAWLPVHRCCACCGSSTHTGYACFPGYATQAWLQQATLAGIECRHHSPDTILDVPGCAAAHCPVCLLLGCMTTAVCLLCAGHTALAQMHG